MAELRTLHLTDIHDDLEKYEVIAEYIAGRKDSDKAVDAVFVTGDFIEGNEKIEGKTANLEHAIFAQYYDAAAVQEKRRQMAVFLKEHNINNEEDVKSLDAASQKQLIGFNKQIIEEHRRSCEKLTAEQTEEILRPFTESYQKHLAALDKIDAPVFGTAGNHDLRSVYESLKDKVTFLDQTGKATIKGKTGLEFIVKGDFNAFEVPPNHIRILPILGDKVMPYASGYSLSELSREINQLQAEVTDSLNDRLEKIAKKEEPKYSEEQLKEMQAQLEQGIEARKKVLEYNLAERQRLGDKAGTDIYLTHKLPNCKKAHSDIEGPLSDVTAEYAANAKAVYGGHFHDGQIGYKTIDDFLKQETTETVTIDGAEVPVYFLNGKEPWELNPGTKYFFVTEYDANKEIEQVIVYEFYYEEAA